MYMWVGVGVIEFMDVSIILTDTANSALIINITDIPVKIATAKYYNITIRPKHIQKWLLNQC